MMDKKPGNNTKQARQEMKADIMKGIKKMHEKKFQNTKEKSTEVVQDESVDEKVKTIKKAAKKNENEGDSEDDIDIMSEEAMKNAFYICHNVQDLMWFR